MMTAFESAKSAETGKLLRFALIGPTWPWRGGIAHYTTFLARQLQQTNPLLLISFSRQYPAWLFPGKSDRDPSDRPLRSEAEYLLDPLNPFSWRRTLRRLQAWEPDVVVMQWWHPFWAPAWSWIGRAVKRLPSRPRLLFICHNVLPHERGRLGRILPPAVRWTLKPGDGFVVHAQSEADDLVRLMPDARYCVTPIPTYGALGADNPVVLPVELPEDRPILLFPGFVRPYKGLDVLLDALPLVLARRPVHLLVAGEFWQGTGQFEAQIGRLGLQHAVTLLDRYLPDEWLAACLQRADVVVLPYRSATQSAIVQAAFGHGKPVITTRVGGLAEAVQDGVTGLTVPPENPAALADAIIRFFTENLGEVMTAAIAAEGNRFSWRTLLVQLESLAYQPTA